MSIFFLEFNYYLIYNDLFNYITNMKNSVLFKVFIAMLAAITVGMWTGGEAALLGIPYVKMYHLIGQLFLNALYLVSVPLVMSSIILGSAKMGAQASFATLGLKTFGFYLLMSSLAVLVAIGSFFLFFPSFALDGIHQAMPSTHLQEGDLFEAISQIFLKIIPKNIFAAATEGQMLGLISFSILFGLFASKTNKAAIILEACEAIFQIVMQMTVLIMKALPIGVFGLVAHVVVTTGIETILSSGWYFFTVILSFAIFSFLIIPFLLLVIAKMNPIKYFKAIAPALFTAFSTSSSAATLPVTMECIEKGVGVTNRICSFSLPLGTSINMSGGALCMCIASLFIASVYGISLTMNVVILIGFLSLLTSMGIAGIPSASLISVAIILNTIGVPAEGLGLIIAVDRILDMFRTTVNVLGNATSTVLIAYSEGREVCATNA